MNQALKNLSATGIHGRYDFEIDFFDRVNIIHGVNGTGKTTLLHILTNIINLDIERFSYLEFQQINVELSDQSTIKLTGRPLNDREHLTQVELNINSKDSIIWPSTVQETENVFALVNPPDIIDMTRSIRTEENITTQATYFPAFRTMIEAWYTHARNDVQRRGHSSRPPPSFFRSTRAQHPPRITAPNETFTDLAREVFGNFVPFIDYPSPREIERRLNQVIQAAINRLRNADRSLLSEVFTKVYDAISTSDENQSRSHISRSSGEIRASIASLLDRLQTSETEFGLSETNSPFADLKQKMESTNVIDPDRQEHLIARILTIYEEAFNQRAEFITGAFTTVREYIDAANNFLTNKDFVIATQDVAATPRIQIRHNDGTYSPLDTMSSGERQIAGLIYSATQVATGNIILVDEPELSLHVDWQRQIINAMIKQLPTKQLFVCTHSPMVASDFKKHMIELKPIPTAQVPNQPDADPILEDPNTELTIFSDLT